MPPLTLIAKYVVFIGTSVASDKNENPGLHHVPSYDTSTVLNLKLVQSGTFLYINILRTLCRHLENYNVIKTSCHG
jgi:hypothetical protein